MSWMGTLQHLLVHEKPNIRNFSGRVSLSTSEDNVSGETFEPEKSYFSVRIVEMRLAQAGRYFVDFVPMCSCFLQFTYGRSKRTIPFVLGSETISAGLQTKVPNSLASRIQFKDIYVVRNAPVKVDNLTMYAALCRFNDTGFARGLLGLLADAANLAGGPGIGATAKGGIDLMNRLGMLLGADGVETRFGMLHGNALDVEGYFIFAGVSATALDAKELVMREGQLVRRLSNGSEETLDDVDYLVIAIEHKSTIVDDTFGQISILPFHSIWEDVRAKLLEEKLDEAKRVLKTLLVAVNASPDLTDRDRLGLVRAYQAAFENWAEVSLGKKTTMSFEPLNVPGIDRNVSSLLQAVNLGVMRAEKIVQSGDANLHNAAALDALLRQGARSITVEIANTGIGEPEFLRAASGSLLAGALTM